MSDTPNPAAPLTDADLAAASRFADCCYDDKLRMPSAAAMARLEAAGVVERLPAGAWGELPRLRELGY